jgi:hypothetical protein
MKTLTFSLVLFFLISTISFAQNIEAKVGNLGKFSVKDSYNNTIFTVFEEDALVQLKNLDLPTTLQYNLGVISKGGDIFLHNFKAPGTQGGNTFLGISAGNTVPEGTGLQKSFNTGIGELSLRSISIGGGNTAVGYKSLNNNMNGYFNVAVGIEALDQATGDANTCIGAYAGDNITTGMNNIVIGYAAQSSSPTVSNQITLGNSSITSLRCNVTSITSLSDARDKKNIKDLSLGLNFLMKVKPREFNWDKREWYDNNSNDGSKMSKTPTAGFIAQELDEVQKEENAEWLNLVLKDNPDKLEATYGNLLPVMVKSIQDLKEEKDKEIASLKTENEQLRKEIQSLKEVQMRLARLEQIINNYEIKFTKNEN